MPPRRGWTSDQFTEHTCNYCRSKSLKTTNTIRKKNHLKKCKPFEDSIRGLLDNKNCTILRQIPADLLGEVAEKSGRKSDLHFLLPDIFPVTSRSVLSNTTYNGSQSTSDVPVLDRSTSEVLRDMHNPAFRLFSDHHDAPFDSRVDASPRRNYNDTGISTELDIPVLNLDAWRDTSFSVHEDRR